MRNSVFIFYGYSKHQSALDILMTLISSLHLPEAPDSPIYLPKRSRKTPRITILLGVNGTGKSRILRSILDQQIASFQSTSTDVKDATRAPLREGPCRVIAVSSTTNDRFPAKSSLSEPRYKTRFNIDTYDYIGPRTSRNLISRRHSLESFISAVLRTTKINSKQAKFLNRLCKKTSISTHIQVYLSSSLNSQINFDPRNFREWLMAEIGTPGLVDKELERLLESNEVKYLLPKLQEFLGRYQSLVIKSKEIKNRNKEAYPFFIDIGNQILLDTPGTTPEIIELALRLKILRITDVVFNNISSQAVKEMRPDDFSAGQWGLFSSLATLALIRENRSLILIDEPETGLHPSWQREFIEDLQDSLVESKDCHVILATHSPLIVGGIKDSDGEVVVLRPNNNFDNISMKLLPAPTGWESSDVLEEIFDLPSTRSPELENLVNMALQYIARGVKENYDKLSALACKLRFYLDKLPEDDSLSPVIETIISVTEKSGKQ
ncbi:MAG TPA: AAA family ATPase [Azospira sp.]|nr:AAA family ATPase [Azospira sp.]